MLDRDLGTEAALDLKIPSQANCWLHRADAICTTCLVDDRPKQVNAINPLDFRLSGEGDDACKVVLADCRAVTDSAWQKGKITRG